MKNKKKGLNIELLTAVRKQVTVEKIVTAGLKGYLIICKPPIAGISARTIIICSYEEMIVVVRHFRILAARELTKRKDVTKTLKV